jgi:FMN phosphatase YigB (HAD superfamily)
MAKKLVLFFDIGNTLAVPVQISDASLALKVFPFVPEVLDRLALRCRLGLLSNTGTETLASMRSVLAKAGLLDRFESGLLVFSSVEGMDKSKPALFLLAAKRADVPPSQCVYISEDAGERATAQLAGFLVSFHPLHTFHVLEEKG